VALAAGTGAGVWYFTKDDSAEKNRTASTNGDTGQTDQVDTTDPTLPTGQTSEAGPAKPTEITEHIQLTGHVQPVRTIMFSPDGKLLASGDSDLTEGPMTRLWDPSDGKLVATLVGPPGTGGASADAVAFSPDGTVLAAGGNFLGDSTRLWNVADRTLIGPLAQSHSIMGSLAFSPDGKAIAGVTHTGAVTIWDVASRQVRIGLPDSDGFRNVTFSPDGTLLANGGKGAEVRLSDAKDGHTIHSITDATGDAVCFSPDGKTLAVPASDGTYSLKLWDVATARATAEFDRLDEIVTSVVYSPDGKTIASWGLGNTVQLWDVKTKRVRAVLIGAADTVNSVAFNPDGTKLAAGGDDMTIRIWPLDKK
jgi:WD40 repeat protein